MEWTDVLRYAWNTAAWALAIAALVALVAPRSRALRQGWRSKALWAISLTVAISVDGAWLYIPIGPPMVLWQLRKGWKSIEDKRIAERMSPVSV